MNRYYINTRGNDDAAYQEAIDFAANDCKADGKVGRIILLALTRKNVGWLERIYDSDTVKKLQAGLKIKGSNAVMQIETLKTYKNNYAGVMDIVISLGNDADDLFVVDDMPGIKTIIAIPWLPEKLEKWVKTWNPQELRGNPVAGNVYPLPSCIVQKAMEDLSGSINMSTGISHPMDERLAKTYIRALHKYERELNADVVGAYLVRELNWGPDDAQEIEKLINTLNSGKFFHGGDKTGLQGYYKNWKKDCGE